MGFSSPTLQDPASSVSQGPLGPFHYSVNVIQAPLHLKDKPSKLYHTSSEGNSVIFLKDTIASSSASGSTVDFIFLSPIGRSFISSRFPHLMMVLWFALNLIAAFAMPSSLLQISYGLPLLFWHLHVMLAP